jgi:hypothetical protein
MVMRADTAKINPGPSPLHFIASGVVAQSKIKLMYAAVMRKL